MSPHVRIKRLLRRFGSGWLAAAVCAGIVLLAGARLVTLSLQQHAAQARSAAQRFGDRAGLALQGELHNLAARAQQRATLAVQTAATTGWRTALQTLPPAHNAFWLSADGKTVASAVAERDIDRDIAAAWSGAAPTDRIAAVQQGSGWLIAMRAPVMLTSGDGRLAPAGWSVAYRNLDDLLVGARLNQATGAGYDFQLARVDAASGRLLAVTGTNPGSSSWSDAAMTPVALPVGFARGAAASWWLALRPRAGWFPASELVVDTSLLILVAWLIALGIRDISRHVVHLRSALAVSRRRLQKAQRRLADELDQRQHLQTTFDQSHYRDSFTGLPNRRFFLNHVDRALREMRTRSGHHIAVVLIAVRRFKVVTDTLGHTAGDELMVQITRLCDQALSTEERVLARWADDELALMLADVSNAEALMDSARSLQHALQTPIELRRHRIMAATSMGATYIDSGLQRAEEVLREADIALSAARAQGSTNLVSYSSAMQAHLMQLVSLEGDLHTALEREEFRLLFQPIVDLPARRIVGVEVLLRWLHPVEGMLRPDRFLSFAEEAGLSVPITHWIILRACQLRGEWRLQLPPGVDFYISVNLSPAALLDPELGDYVANVLTHTGTSPASLKFELTENSLISNVGAAHDALDRLHAMGIELMLDDFGTGYSSLSHLQMFPFDYVKIDGPFDNRLSPGHGNAALVRAMTQMASTLGLKTIAEIVETNSAVEILQQAGCEFAQGNAFCAPVDAEQTIAHLRTQVLEPTGEPEQLDDSPTLILPVVPESAIS